MNFHKTKISMTCVYKQYEVKMKMVQKQQLHLKMKFLLGYNMQIVIYWGDKNLMGHFSWWRGMNKLFASAGGGRRGRGPILPVGKTLQAAIWFYSRVPIFKTNNLQKETGYPRLARMIEFEWSKFLQLKPWNAVNF